MTDALEHSTSYEYTGLGELESWTDAMGRTTRLEYDHAGHRTARVLPMLQREEWTHGPDGKVETHRDFMGRLTVNHHDAFGRLERVEHPESPEVQYEYWPGGRIRSVTVEGEEPVTYEYEGIGTAPAGHGRGWLHSITNSDYRIEHGYDAAGRRTLTRTIVPQPGGGQDVHEVEYTFDAAGLLWQVKEGGVAQVTYDHDAASHLRTAVHANGVTASYQPDVAGRTRAITWTHATHGTLASFEWAFDEAGRHHVVTEGGGRTVTHVHDAANRLVEEEHALSGACERRITYDHDPVGNRISKTVECPTGPPEITTSVHDENDRLIQSGVVAYEHDPNGNVTRAGDAEYRWDDQGRLVGADLDGDGSEEHGFEYGVDGLRHATTSGGVRRVHVVDGTFAHAQVIEERSDAGALLTRYLRGHQAIRQDAGGTSRWLLHDHLGSTRALADGAGGWAGSIDYEAFGSELRTDGDAATGLRFTGEQWEEELGLTYLRARWMSPGEGRFMSPDPMWYPALAPSVSSLHTYGTASPLMVRDPSGLWPEIALPSFNYVNSRGAAQMGVLAAGSDKIPFRLRPVLVKYSAWEGDHSMDGTLNDSAYWLDRLADLTLQWADAEVETDPAYLELGDGELGRLLSRWRGHGTLVVFADQYDSNACSTRGRLRVGLALGHLPVASIGSIAPVADRGIVLAHELGHTKGLAVSKPPDYADAHDPNPANLMHGSVATNPFLSEAQRKEMRLNVLKQY